MESLSLQRFKTEEEARKKAKDDLRALIKSSGGRMTCKALQSVREDLERRKDEADRELLFNIEKKVSELSKGVQMLSEKEEVTKDIRAKIASIKELWAGSCGRFSDVSDLVDDLLQKKRFVEQVLGMLRNFLDMETDVKELEKKLSDEEEIFSVYKKIKVMNYMRQSFLAKIDSSQNSDKGSQTQQRQLSKIKEHFRTVRELEKQFHEQVVFGNLQNIHILAKKNPSLLVKVLRVVENDEVASNSIQQKFKQQEQEEQKKQNIEMLARDPSEAKQLFKKGGVKNGSGNHLQQDADERQISLKESSIGVLKVATRRRAQEFFQAEVEPGRDGKQPSPFMCLLQRGEALVGDLKYIRNVVEPCFPPSYKLFELHFQTYKRELQERFDQLLAGPQMDAVLTDDPEAILFFSGFVQTCQGILAEVGFEDDFFLNLQIRLEEFYPRFMDHAESKFFERLQRILEEQKAQEAEKVEIFGKAQGKKKKAIVYETSFAVDIFDFMQAQLEAIQESLKGEKLLEFIKRMLEQLVSLCQHVVQFSLEEQEQSDPKQLIALLVRLNDLVKVAQEFERFKEQAVAALGEKFAGRVDGVLDDFLRQLIGLAHEQAEVVALYIVRGDVQHDLLIHFFTVTWKDNPAALIQETLKCANGYMQDVFKVVKEERFAAKVAEALYSLLVDAYVERFVIAVNFRYKLKLVLQQPLLSFIYKDACLPKGSANKQITKKDLVDLYSKSIDGELFELMQKDIMQFQAFREAYKDEIMQTRFNNKIQMLSYLSLMVNAANEDEFADYETKLWALIAGAHGKDNFSSSTELDEETKRIIIAPGGIHLDGYHIVRICRKIKTKNKRQKGFFDKTKQKEKQEKKLLKQKTHKFIKQESSQKIK